MVDCGIPSPVGVMLGYGANSRSQTAQSGATAVDLHALASHELQTDKKLSPIDIFLTSAGCRLT